MPGRFDAIVFDWYATLGSPAGNDWWQQMFSLISDAGGSTPAHALLRWQEPDIDHRAHSATEESYREYEARLLKELLEASGLPEAAQRGLQATILELRELETIKIFPDVVDLLCDLRAANKTVAICSNWSWDLDRHLATNEIEDLFDLVVCSAVVGYRKPHPGIFAALLSQLDFAPDRIAFVGDDWSADIEGATAAGLVPFHLARAGCSVTEHELALCAADLNELRSHLLE